MALGILSVNPLDTLQRAWRRGPRLLRILAATGVGFAIVGVGAVYLSFDYFFERIGNVLIGIAILIWFYMETVLRADEQEAIEARVQRAEDAVAAQPDKARPLWDLARSRLELYFERNLAQIRSIFWVTVVVMLAGFSMMGYGIVRAFEGANIQAPILAAASGVLTEFIAATFLLIYRSIMSQASDYVRTLERINAVGMSIQIVDSITDEDTTLKNKFKADLGIKIMDTFAPVAIAPPTIRRTAQRQKQN